MNPNNILLSSNKHFYRQHVYYRHAMLSYIREFKKCEICGRRLQLWTSMNELKRINGLRPVDTAQIGLLADRIFNAISEL